ncbi:hypothetical protein DNJ73_04680 [Prochlorococcus marinus XMU1408]|uniref:Uncharacterized protein n=1 Tax=Prochlorococcus marinus XMU1408 TaxID=2213228 RepID=A0A318R5C2_PROMR|nr:hypothetical protein [Prochlorococcus marinus str. XMU1408]PYE03290.1 hypothetical protein DNJ73_04680 [Prochlorococcus marinus XMU1408]
MDMIFIFRLYRFFKYNWLQITLIILSLYDLRIDIRLLFDFFTLSTLFYTISDHPLAITILIMIPSRFNSLKTINK